jgi:adenosine kinase
MKPARANIIVTGSLAYDYIMRFPGRFQDVFAHQGEAAKRMFPVHQLKKQHGGCAGNIAYTLALLGECPRVVCVVGEDFKDYGECLQKQGVDTSGVITVTDEHTATCFITSDEAQNQITSFYSGAMLQGRNISIKAQARPDLLIIAPDDTLAMLRHAQEAREAQIPFIYDLSSQVTDMNGEELWAGAVGARALVMNDYEFGLFREKTGRSAEEVLAEVEMLVITLAEKGSVIRTAAGATIPIPPAQVQEVVDPTGGGDAYRGGFAAGLVRGEPLEVCGRMGSVAAAYCVEKHGPQNHHYTAEEFQARYDANFTGENAP